MKNIYILALLLTALVTNAQTGIGTATPNASLDVRATEDEKTPDGIIAPQLTYDALVAKNNAYGTEQKGAIVYAITGPTVADTNTASKTYEVTQPGYYYFNGTQWEKFAKDVSAWNLNGNNITTAYTADSKLISGDFVGTTNNNPLLFKTNNQFIGYLKSGIVSLGIDAYSAKSLSDSENLVAIGRGALKSNTTGNNNVGIGTRALTLNTSGINNVAIGIGTLESNIKNGQNTSVGTNSSKLLGGDNSTTSTNNTALGMSALMNLKEGSRNVAIGASSLQIADTSTVGNDNTAVGFNSLYNIFKGNYGQGNTALGTNAGMNVYGDRNIFIGRNVSFSTTNQGAVESKRILKSNSMNIGNVIFGANILSSDTETYQNSKGLVGIGAAKPKAKLHISPYLMSDSDTSKATDRLVDEVLIVEGIKPAGDTEVVTTMVVTEDGYVRKKPVSNSNTPQFFYMPSVLLPTNDTGTANVIYAPAADTGVISGIYTADLHKIFSEQFNTPIASSDSSTTGLSGFVLANDRYEYHVIYADTNVFTNIKVSNVGVLTYQVNREAIIRNGAFMNIVLKVK